MILVQGRERISAVRMSCCFVWAFSFTRRSALRVSHSDLETTLCDGSDDILTNT